jgi:hypothetical protein
MPKTENITWGKAFVDLINKYNGVILVAELAEEALRGELKKKHAAKTRTIFKRLRQDMVDIDDAAWQAHDITVAMRKKIFNKFSRNAIAIDRLPKRKRGIK